MKKSVKKDISLIFFIASIGLCQNIQADSTTRGYTGFWLTEDDETIVKISHCKHSLCGRIAGFIYTKQADKTLSKVEKKKGLRELKAICSTDLMGGFTKASRGWGKGWIIDFETEKEYSANLQLMKNGTLKLRAYKRFKTFGEDLFWKRTDKPQVSCAEILEGNRYRY